MARPLRIEYPNALYHVRLNKHSSVSSIGKRTLKQLEDDLRDVEFNKDPNRPAQSLSRALLIYEFGVIYLFHCPKIQNTIGCFNKQPGLKSNGDLTLLLNNESFVFSIIIEIV